MVAGDPIGSPLPSPHPSPTLQPRAYETHQDAAKVLALSGIYIYIYIYIYLYSNGPESAEGIFNMTYEESSRNNRRKGYKYLLLN